MENNESLTVISAWKNFTILDCVKHIVLSYTAHSLGGEGFGDFTDDDIAAELMADKELSEDDLVNLVCESESDKSDEEELVLGRKLVIILYKMIQTLKGLYDSNVT